MNFRVLERRNFLFYDLHPYGTKYQNFHKKKSQISLFFDVFWEIFFEIVFARKNFGMGFSTDLGRTFLFPLKFC